ncbi:outer membrane lipoprotein carrier protein LolA [Paenarthrobacter sp. NPDC058040]|uniref:LolA family protein n=1 Tax=unclassified Paenarthrobacter TaxID=2634190 RepID=UPI0036DC2CA9
MSRAKQRWLPALLIPLALIAAILVGSIQAGAAPSLPPKSAAEILAMIAKTSVRAFSGTVSQEANLGLPDVGTGVGAAAGAGSALEFLSGSHTARVYVDAPGQARVQVLDRMAERDVIVNGTDAWFYNSSDNSVVHAALPSRTGTSGTEVPPARQPRYGELTPEALATRFLAAVDSSTEVTVGGASTVAGRSAYSLTLTPRSADTLVDSVTINADSETGFPLGVTVKAKGQAEPAYSLAFTELVLSAPDAALFTFTPPAGATVKEEIVAAKPAPPLPVPETTTPAPDAPRAMPLPHPGPSITGEGWGSVMALPAGSAPAGLLSNPQLSQVLQPVAGGRALTTSLVSVLILDDGRVLAGMVPLDRLESAAAAG